jgi:hypothetical protein
MPAGPAAHTVESSTRSANRRPDEVVLLNNNAAWKSTRVATGAPIRPLEADPDDLGGAVAARRELGIEAEQALVEGFLNRAGQAIDARVDERIAQHRAAMTWPERPEPDRRRTGPRLALAICSLVAGIPLTAIATAMSEASGVVLVVIVWIAILGINISFNRSSH